MLNIDMEFKKGILFIRLEGLLNKKNTYKFEQEVIPVVLKHEIKYVVINLDKVICLDSSGVNILIELNDIVKDFNGKTTLCSLTNLEVRKIIHAENFKKLFYETNNELSALGVMKI